MKKLIVCLIILLSLTSTATLYAPKVSATAYTTATLNPSQLDSWMYWGSGSGNGTVYEFSVDVVITNVTNMAGWQFGLFWNNHNLNCDSVTIKNPSTWTETISINVSKGVDNSYNSTNGYFCYANAATRGSAPYSNTTSLVIATMYFHQLENISSTTPLNFANTELVDSDLNDIPFSSIDGSVLMHTGVETTTVLISGNGSPIELSPYPANRDNWNCSQSNDGDTSYVYSSFEDSYPYVDLYVVNCSWIPASATNVVATVHMVVRSTSTHKASCHATLNASSTGMQYGSAYTPSTSYEDDSSPFNITQSDGGTLQIGVQIASAPYRIGGIWYYSPGYCTEVYAIITWS